MSVWLDPVANKSPLTNAFSIMNQSLYDVMLKKLAADQAAQVSAALAHAAKRRKKSADANNAGKNEDEEMNACFD